jgi:hypothetical protein
MTITGAKSMTKMKSDNAKSGPAEQAAPPRPLKWTCIFCKHEIETTADLVAEDYNCPMCKGFGWTTAPAAIEQARPQTPERSIAEVMGSNGLTGEEWKHAAAAEPAAQQESEIVKVAEELSEAMWLKMNCYCSNCPEATMKAAKKLKELLKQWKSSVTSSVEQSLSLGSGSSTSSVTRKAEAQVSTDEPAPERTPRLSYRKWLLEKQADGFAGILSKSLEDAYGDYCARAVVVPEPAAQPISEIPPFDWRCKKCHEKIYNRGGLNHWVHENGDTACEPAPTPSRPNVETYIARIKQKIQAYKLSGNYVVAFEEIELVCDRFYKDAAIGSSNALFPAQSAPSAEQVEYDQNAKNWAIENTPEDCQQVSYRDFLKHLTAYAALRTAQLERELQDETHNANVMQNAIHGECGWVDIFTAMKTRAESALRERDELGVQIDRLTDKWNETQARAESAESALRDVQSSLRDLLQLRAFIGDRIPTKNKEILSWFEKASKLV